VEALDEGAVDVVEIWEEKDDAEEVVVAMEDDRDELED
jgi:hypothetical protein